LPVAEALAFGKFVIASDRGSIPEVGGDLVEYVDPWNPAAWAEAIAKYWDDSALLESREKRIRSEYHPIHWEESAAAVLELIGTVSDRHLSRIELEPGYDLTAIAGVHFGSRILAAGEGGTLCHGPYRPLPAGPTRIDVEIESRNEERLLLEFKFVADKGAWVIQRETRKVIEGCSTLHFDVNLKRAVEDFEVVITAPDRANLAISKVVISLDASAVEQTPGPLEPTVGTPVARAAANDYRSRTVRR
jgi:hypothetical protein